MNAIFNAEFTATNLIEVYFQIREVGLNYEKLLSFSSTVVNGTDMANYLESHLTNLSIEIQGETITGRVNSMSRNLSDDYIRVQIKCDM